VPKHWSTVSKDVVNSNLQDFSYTREHPGIEGTGHTDAVMLASHLSTIIKRDVLHFCACISVKEEQSLCNCCAREV